MKWYEGNIAEAVTLSRTNNAVFVVYIQGSADLGVNLNPLLEDNVISSTLSSSSFVAIKVEAGSVPHQQFSQIYRDTPIPSIYFIGKSGSALDIVKESLDRDGFLEKVNNILRINGTPIPSISSSVSTSPSPSPSTPSTSSSSFIANELAATSTEVAATTTEVVCDGDICTIKPKDTEAGNSSDAENKQPELSHDDKVRLAKELIDKKRIEKQKEDEEKERLKELERRKMGQEVQNLQRWQKDQELKTLMDERAKVKQEEKLARQRILEQIAQDKADRAIKFTPPVNEAKETSPPVVPRSTSNRNTARLQFRLADGSTRTQDFEATDTLAQVRSYVRDTLHLNACKLSMTFPRREFTAEDDGSTLVDLSLVPNAVLLVLAGGGGSVAGGGGGPGGILSAAGGTGSGLVAMLWSLFTPIINVLGWIKSLLFGGTATGGGSDGAVGSSGATTSGVGSESARAAEKRAAPPTDSSNRLGGESRPMPKRKSGDGGTVIRRHGNVHRLTDPNDSDDDNNTWNGNSTQQM